MMTCAQFEISFTDYLDGTLPQAERVSLEEHLAACGSCRSLADEITSALHILSAASDIEVPAELITRIAYQAPLGRIRDPLERQSLISKWVNSWLQPILQPRLVMGMAMTVLSFAMLERCTGVKVQQIQAADLNPVRIWSGAENKVLRTRDRAVKYYENLRWVYEIEVRLRAMQDQQAAESEAQQQAPGGQSGAPQSTSQEKKEGNGETK